MAVGPVAKVRVWLLALLAAAALVGVVLPFVWTRSDAPGRPAWVETWYADPGYQFLVPVARQVTPEYTKGVPLALVGLKMLENAPAGLVSPLPVGSKTRLLYGRGSEATVEVRLARAIGSGEERLIIGAIVRTVAGTPGADKVRVRLAGEQNQPLVSTHEDLGRAFTADSPEVRNTWDGEPGPRITVWFRLKGTGYLVPLDMASPLAEMPLEGTVQALMSPPPGAGTILEAPVPSGAGLGFAGSPASGSYLVEWMRPDVPDDVPDRIRLVTATVLSLTERGARTVEFRSPAGPITREMPLFHLSRPISRDDARAGLKADLPPG